MSHHWSVKVKISPVFHSTWKHLSGLLVITNGVYSLRSQDPNLWTMGEAERTVVVLRRHLGSVGPEWCKSENTLNRPWLGTLAYFCIASLHWSSTFVDLLVVGDETVTQGNTFSDMSWHYVALRARPWQVLVNDALHWIWKLLIARRPTPSRPGRIKSSPSCPGLPEGRECSAIRDKIKTTIVLLG